VQPLPTVTSTRAGTNHRRPAHLELLARAAAIMAATGLAISCSHHTAGTAMPARTSASTTAPAATHTSAPAAAPTSTATSDEDQARQTVQAFNDAYNTQNWQAYTELMCTAMRAQFTGVVMDYVKKGRASNGPNTIKSMTIAITGDTATATINGANEALGPGTIKLPLKREDGWKVCQVYHP
jgi:hypothetical protein